MTIRAALGLITCPVVQPMYVVWVDDDHGDGDHNHYDAFVNGGGRK